MYDAIIAGGGAAGLSLAYHLVNAPDPLRAWRILLVDRQPKTRNDRTWCFWSRDPLAISPIVHRCWEHVWFISDTFEKRLALSPYSYQMVRGLDFYKFTHSALAACPNVTLLSGVVEDIVDGDDLAKVRVDGQTYAGRWVFNGLFDPAEFAPDRQGYIYLKQHFKGWEVESDRPVFDPQAATLFDFRSPGQAGVPGWPGATCFFYVLPFSAQRALVEYTLFSPALLEDQHYDQALRTYLAERLGLSAYRILDEEKGAIPMTDQPFPRRAGRRVMTIGTRGGRVKPSTGYAFLRIQRDSAAILASLLRSGHPFDVSPTPWRYGWYDRVMLRLMATQAERMPVIFTALFKNNPIGRIFRFLDEVGPVEENLALMASLPTWPMLRAAFDLMRPRRRLAQTAEV